MPEEYKYRGVFTGEAPMNPPTTLNQFDKLVTELRQHILLFCKPKERYNYASCSSDCNRDIQIFKKVAPQKITIEWDKESNGTKITLCYKTHFPDFICKPIGKSDYGLVEAAEIMARILTRARSMESTQLHLDHKIWPVEIMNHAKMAEILLAKVTILEANFTSFVEYLNKSRVKKLVLEPVQPRSRFSKFVIPNSFFKSEGFKRLDQFTIKLNADIDEADFLSCTARTMTIKSTKLNSEMVNKKLRQWNEGRSPIGHTYHIYKMNGKFKGETVRNGFTMTRPVEVRRADDKRALLSVDGNYVQFRSGELEDFDFM